jgi:anti-sigma factor ChrR (cupin superfamily)
VSSHVFVLEVSDLTHVPRQVSEQSCICVLEVSVLTHVPRQVSEQSCICVRGIGFDSCTKTGK